MKIASSSLLKGVVCAGLALACFSPAHAVIIQAEGNTTAADPGPAGSGSGPGTFSVNYTVQSSSNMALVIAMVQDGALDPAVLAPSLMFNGVAPTNVVASFNDRGWLAYWNVPFTPGTYALTGDYGTGTSFTTIGHAWELSAVDVSAPANTGTGGALTTTTDDRFVFGAFGINSGNGSNGSGAPAAGSVISTFGNINSGGVGGGTLAYGYGTAGAAGPQNISWVRTGGSVNYAPVGLGLVSNPDPGTWNRNTGGNWNSAANWAGGIPAANGTATFGSALYPINAPGEIALDVPVSLSKMVFASGARYDITGPSALTLTGGSEINVLNGTHEISAALSGTVNKTGAGTIILSGNYTGAATVTAGALSLGNVAAAPASVNVMGGNLHFTEGYTGAYAGAISGAGPAPGADLSAPAVVFDASLGANTVSLTGNNTYTGRTDISGGVVLVTTAGKLGTTGAVDGSDRTNIGGGTGRISVSGGNTHNENLRLTGRTGDNINAPHLSSTSNNTWFGNIKADGTGSANIESTTGTLTLSGTLSTGGTVNYIFSGDGNFNVTGKITDGTTDNAGAFTTASTTANVTVIKRGAGTLTIRTPSSDPLLTFDDRWQNGTTVEGGTLEVIAATGNVGELYGPLAVRAGATLDVDSFSNYSLQPSQALSGGGTVQLGAGSLVLYDDNSLSPGDPAANNGVGTLKVNGNVSLNSDVVGGGVLTFQLSDNPAAQAIDNIENDLINVSGNLAVSGAPAFTFNISPTEGGLGLGTYKLIDYAGSNTITLGTTTVNYQSAPIAGEAQYNVNSRQTLAISPAAGQLNLTVGGSAAASLTWTGVGTQVWDVAGDSSTNWSGADSKFYDFDSVTFNDSSNVNTIAIGALVTPGATTFTSATGRTYSFGGGDSAATPANNVGFRGLGPINLTGNVNVVLDNWQNRIHGAVSLGAGTSLKLGSTTLVTVNPSTEIFGVISGSGAISIDEGTHAFRGANTFTSNVVINGGTLNMDNATALGTPAGTTTVNMGATLLSDADTYTTAEPITVNGGTLSFTGASGVTLSGPITVGASGMILNVTGGTTTFSGGVTGGGGAITLNGGAGDLVIDSAFTATGVLTKTGGNSLSIGPNGSIASSEIVLNGGQLNVSGRPEGYTLASGQLVSASNFAGTGNVVGLLIAGSGSTIRTGADAMPVPEGATDPVGELFDVNGSITMSSGSRLEVDVFSTTIFDLLQVKGTFTAGGTLDVDLASGGVAPALGSAYKVVTYLDRVGTFAAIDTSGMPSLAAGLSYSVVYSPKFLELKVVDASAGQPGDFNGDNMVNAADYTVWRDGLGTTYTVADYDTWVANYGAGTASTDQGATAPEPTAIALLALGALGFSVRRRAEG